MNRTNAGLAGLNRDVTHLSDVTRNETTSDIDASMQVDHRALSSEGRSQIIKDFKQDANFAKAIGETFHDGILDPESGLTPGNTFNDFYSKFLFQQVLTSDPDLAEAYAKSGNLLPTNRDPILQEIYDRMKASDIFGILGMKDGAQILSSKADSLSPAFRDKETGNTYLNDWIQTMGDMMKVTGHDVFGHGMASGYEGTEAEKEAYANYVGSVFLDRVNDALWVNGQNPINTGSMINWGLNDPITQTYLNANTTRQSLVPKDQRDNFDMGDVDDILNSMALSNPYMAGYLEGLNAVSLLMLRVRLLVIGGKATAEAAAIAQEVRAVTMGTQAEARALFAATETRAITIEGKVVEALPREGGAAVFQGVTDAQVESYFLKLTGATKLPEPIAVEIRGQTGIRYTIETPQGSFTLRDISSSIDRSGPAWTIDVPKEASGIGRTAEIKFVRELP